jgi:hypothetical protein
MAERVSTGVAVSPLLSGDGIARLREALEASGYTRQVMEERLGQDVYRDLWADRAPVDGLGKDDRLRTWIGLYLYWEALASDAVSAALAPLPMADAMAAGLIREADDGIRAGVSLHPYENWWVIADIPGRARPWPMRPDHVLDANPSSDVLCRATVRSPVETALDLGTGCGVQALHLSTHASQITATDLSERALRFAATTAALNGLEWELLHGDMVAPVAGRRFDLVVSNPPYVLGPGSESATFLYRDSGRSGDTISAELVAAASNLLTDGGFLQFATNWAHVRGEDWHERVAGWVAGTGLDAWVLQRGSTPAEDYVDKWLSETGEVHDPGCRQTWLDWFDSQGVEAVGFGYVSVRNSGRADPVVRVEDAPTIDQPLGSHVPGWFHRQDWLRDHDPLSARYLATSGLRLDQHAVMNGAGWEVSRQILSMPSGMRWSEEVDQLTVELIVGSAGAVPLQKQLETLAEQHDLDSNEVMTAMAPVVARLVERDMLRPIH